MKKFISLMLVLSLASLFLIGCEKYEPTLAEYNTIYRDTLNNEADGSYPVINIINIEKKEGNLIVEIGAPTIKQIAYAFDNFLTIRPMDSEGDELQFDKMHLTKGKGDTEAELTVTGINIDKLKYFQIGPYKNGENPVVFEIK